MLVSTKKGYACAIIVHTLANQLLPQLLIDQFDTLYTQYRHIEHMHEGVCSQKLIIHKITVINRGPEISNSKSVWTAE